MDLSDALGGSPWPQGQSNPAWPGGSPGVGAGGGGGGVWPGGNPSQQPTAPGGWPSPAPAPGPGGWPGPAPAPGPGGWPSPAPGPAPGPGGWPSPATGPAPGPGGWPSPAPGPAPGPGGWPSPAPAPGPAPGGWPSPAPAPGPAPGGWPSPAQGPGPNFPTAPQQSLSVPYQLNLPNGVYDKLLITIAGTPTRNCDKFTVDLTTSKDLALKLNPRFNDHGKKTVVRNSCIGGQWGKEERELKHFPFAQGQPFEIKILCTNSEFRVAVNNSHLLEYKHRITNIRSINKLGIYKDVTLSKVHMETVP